MRVRIGLGSALVLLVPASAPMSALARGVVYVASTGSGLHEVNLSTMDATLLDGGIMGFAARGLTPTEVVYGNLFSGYKSFDRVTRQITRLPGNHPQFMFNLGEGGDGSWYRQISGAFKRVNPYDPNEYDGQDAGVLPFDANDFAFHQGRFLALADGALYEVSLANGHTTFLSNTGIQGSGGLASTLDGKLIVGTNVGDLYSVHAQTGQSLFLGNCGILIADLGGEAVPAPLTIMPIAAMVIAVRRRR